MHSSSPLSTMDNIMRPLLLVAFFSSAVWASKLPSIWPRGTYALPMPIGGCPNTYYYWKTGRRYQDTTDVFPNNKWSNPLHLYGSKSWTHVEQNFCVKTDYNMGGGSNPDWEPGQYCIFKKGKFCPDRFREGWIKWDDQNIFNRNDQSGELPEGVYDDDTKIYFCCREDGDAGTPLTLPVDKPFFLFRKNGNCQAVDRMTVLVEWFRWDGQDDLIDLNKYRDGSVPDLENKSGDNHKLMYCYYSYTMGNIMRPLLLVAFFSSAVWAAKQPSVWPRGTYALPMPIGGCPNTYYYWKTGWRYQDTADFFPSNRWSNPLHLYGSKSLTHVEQHFCVKTDLEMGNGSNPDWEPGQYCIFKKGKFCPDRFSEGWIKWDDKNHVNDNDKSGELPEGVYDDDTKIYFCCREDGDVGSPLTLPIDKPFFLFRKNGDCQAVDRMTMLVEWFRWDGENDLIDFNKYRDGSVPDLKNIGGDNHKLMYCYYY
ncbi:uncharacterized protein LOC110983241 [Acanthaster planci]|uniref:Uncharacterized protein LOC110983241 n=1 Tax=Acanthaster planci TaxID=133434 RepID=A0A8B7YZA8_ACAPL|nr:uncharacterized protein LOC110983241 [Acanthaster planci]